MRQLRPVERQWIFTPTALNNTPSLNDGIDLETELKSRKLTIEYMRSLALRANAMINNNEDAEGSHLRGSLIVGSTLIHRFYMRRSFKDFPEKLIAPTILFLATKIEEEPLKLRHIVNVCISKFDPGSRGWYPDLHPNEQPTSEYRSWEKQILATEEVVLETLCFDMGVEQPFTILLKSIKGLDELLAKSSLSTNGHETQNGIANGNGNGSVRGKGKLTESIVTEFGWTLLSESTLSPLSILYPAQVIAFTVLILVISMVDQVPLSEGLINASELSDRFGLELKYDFENAGNGIEGVDLDIIKSCLSDFINYINLGLIDENLKRYIVAEPEISRTETYTERFSIPSIQQNGNLKNNENTPIRNGIEKNGNPNEEVKTNGEINVQGGNGVVDIETGG